MDVKEKLFTAIEKQKPLVVSKLLRSGQINLHDKESIIDDLLMRAVEIGNTTIVRLLVKHGANYNSTYWRFDGTITVFEAAVLSGKEEIVKYFLTLGPTNGEIVRALSWAMHNNAIYHMLMGGITDINCRCSLTGKTPLMAVVDSANLSSMIATERVELLLYKGANKELADRERRKAYDIAENYYIRELLSNTTGKAANIRNAKYRAIRYFYSGSEFRSIELFPDDKLGCFFAGLCMLIPPIGFILSRVWRDVYPEKAKSAGYCALGGLITEFLLGIRCLLSYFGILSD